MNPIITNISNSPCHKSNRPPNWIMQVKNQQNGCDICDDNNHLKCACHDNTHQITCTSAHTVLLSVSCARHACMSHHFIEDFWESEDWLMTCHLWRNLFRELACLHYLTIVRCAWPRPVSKLWRMTFVVFVAVVLCHFSWDIHHVFKPTVHVGRWWH